MIEFVSLLDVEGLAKLFGLAFVTIVIIGVVHASYVIEDMGDEE